MAFIGNTNTTQAFTPAIDYFSGTGSATAFTLSRPVASVAQVQVTIDNVTQNPSSAYTVSGSTITFTSAPLSGTNNIYVYYTSPITQVIAPGQGTVTTAALDVYGGAGTSAMNLPSGTTAQRPSSPVNGAARMNTTTRSPEWYSSTVSAWFPFSTSPTYSIDYLVVAGGGSGGAAGAGAGGGGAGGMLSSSATVNVSASYPVTIGAGGTGPTYTIYNNGIFNGTNSSVFDVTATGGGGGSSGSVPGGNGGSGGGGNGGYISAPGSGTSGQGNAGGTASGGANYAAGGGGGKGSVGGNAPNNATGGNGGSGAVWLDGTTRAGGGGGGTYQAGTAGSGGSGGGGSGGAGEGANGGNATANTGSGGGGGGGYYSSSKGGNGGSGVVIIRYLGATRGSGGTITSSGGYTYHTFTTSDTFTA